MAQSLLVLQLRGAAGALPSVSTMVGATLSQLGNNFGRLSIDDSTIVGVFTPGEALIFGGPSAATTANLTSFSAASGGYRGFYLNTINTAPSTGTITGGTSGATATIGSPAGYATFEGCENNTAQNYRSGRVIQYGNIKYVLSYNDIYKYDYVSGNWESVHRKQFPATTAGIGSDLGLYVFTVSGAPLIGTVYNFGANRYRTKSTDGGATWSDALIDVGAGGASTGSTRGCVFNNVLYYKVGGGAGSHESWDPSTDGFSSNTVGTQPDLSPGAGYICPDFCVWRNILYCIRPDSAFVTNEFAVWKFGSGSWTNVVRFTAQGNVDISSFGMVHCPMLFVGDDDDLYATFYAGSAGGVQGWSMYHITESLGVYTPTSVSNPVLPAGLRWQAGGTDYHYGRWEKDIDGVTNGAAGGPLIINLWFAADDTLGTPRDQYLFNGPAAPLTLQDTGATVSVNIPNDNRPGGLRSWVSGQLSATIESKTAITGGIRLSFKLYQPTGSAPVAGVKFRLLFRLLGEEPLQSASLSNPSVGTISGGNENQGLTADGTTVYQVDWLAISSDSVPNFTRFQAVPLVRAI